MSSASEVDGTKSEADQKRGAASIPNVPTLFPTKRKSYKKPNGTAEVVYQTQLGPLLQSSLIGSERYNESVAEPDDAAPQAASLHRYRARVLYDGSNYHGWQLQPRQPSVQGLLEAVLSFKLRSPIRVIGAGRTDTGVHARGQAVHFDTPAPIDDLARFQHSVNMVLPFDVRVTAMQPTAGLVYVDLVGCYKRWHAIYSATGKRRRKTKNKPHSRYPKMRSGDVLSYRHEDDRVMRIIPSIHTRAQAKTRITAP
jgi:hypothetical protein